MSEPDKTITLSSTEPVRNISGPFKFFSNDTEWLDLFGQYPNADLYKKHLDELHEEVNKARRQMDQTFEFASRAADNADSAIKAAKECQSIMGENLEINERISRNVNTTTTFVYIALIMTIAILVMTIAQFIS